jgi:hypothetical protein
MQDIGNSQKGVNVMAASPQFKVYKSGEYIAAFKYADDAAMLAGARGGQVRYGHSKWSVVWTEGEEEFAAGESWDDAACVILERVTVLNGAHKGAIDTEP